MKHIITPISIFFLLATSIIPAFAGDTVAEIEYFYSDDGTIIGKAFNGKRVNFEYDLRGQLLAVKDASGNDLERYTYDPAGNRLSKTINGVTTTYSYDEANQLIRSTVNGEITYYEYDAAGRMIQAGDKSYIYNGNNKVSEVRQNGETIAKFEYNIDGQIAKAIYGDKKEEFIWDGLALIWRSGVTYINEPYVTGGNPVMAGDDVLFNDMLGSTLAVNDKAVEMTSFGETDNENVFFTGKPMIDELGYSFLFRDYNPNQGKWTTSDPLGYPDGWNNLAYVNNRVSNCFDFAGTWGADVHSAINAALAGTYGEIEWYDSEIDTVDELDDGSDAVDSLWNQVFGNEFEHGMRSAGQTVEQARTAWNNFMTSCVQEARALSDKGRKDKDAEAIEDALVLLGKAVHALADSFAPPHAGFQEWNPPYWVAAPIPGVEDFWDYVNAHTSAETYAHYEAMRDSVNNAIIKRFRADFLYIIKE